MSFPTNLGVLVTSVLLLIMPRDDERSQIQDGCQSILSKGQLYLIFRIERLTRYYFPLI